MSYTEWFTEARLSVVIAALTLLVATLSLIQEKTAISRLFARAEHLRKLVEGASNEEMRSDARHLLDLTQAKINSRLKAPTNGFLLLTIIAFSSFSLSISADVGPLKFIDEPVITESVRHTASNLVGISVFLIAPTFLIISHRFVRRYEFIKHAKYVYYVDKTTPEEARLKTLLPILVLRFLIATKNDTPRVRRHLAYEEVARRSHYRGALAQLPFARLFVWPKITDRHMKNLMKRDLPGKKEWIEESNRLKARKAKRRAFFRRIVGNPEAPRI